MTTVLHIGQLSVKATVLFEPRDDCKWSSTAFFDVPDGSAVGYGDTKEEAMFLLFVKAVSGWIETYRD